MPRTVADVQATVAFAREHGLRVAPQGTGHNASALGALDRTVLVKLHEMKAVDIDVDARTFRAEAGVVWLEVTSQLKGTGLVPPLGSSPDVGLMGYTLGGGFCWLGRKYGLATNNVLAIEVVLADGSFVRATAEDHADLFWALRGGGGNFGIVTAVEMRHVRRTRRLRHHAVLRAGARGRGAARVGASTSTRSTDDTTSYAAFMAFPPIPDVPEPIRGESLPDGQGPAPRERGRGPRDRRADARARRRYRDGRHGRRRGAQPLRAAIRRSRCRSSSAATRCSTS